MISPHVSYREATQSQTAVRLGLNNTPGPVERTAMELVARHCYEPIVAHFGIEPYISSFYRSAKVNAAVGGAAKSQHRTGEAIDIDCDVYGGITNGALFRWLKDNVEYDQIIWEFGTASNPEWVHISYSATRNRHTLLKAVRIKGVTSYLPWTP